MSVRGREREPIVTKFRSSTYHAWHLNQVLQMVKIKDQDRSTGFFIIMSK